MLAQTVFELPIAAGHLVFSFVKREAQAIQHVVNDGRVGVVQIVWLVGIRRNVVLERRDDFFNLFLSQ